MNDLLQYAFEKPDCCYRTCLSLRLRGRKLDNFSEIGSVSGLKDGSVIELVEGTNNCTQCDSCNVIIIMYGVF